MPSFNTINLKASNNNLSEPDIDGKLDNYLEQLKDKKEINSEKIKKMSIEEKQELLYQFENVKKGKLGPKEFCKLLSGGFKTEKLEKKLIFYNKAYPELSYAWVNEFIPNGMAPFFHILELNQEQNNEEICTLMINFVRKFMAYNIFFENIFKKPEFIKLIRKNLVVNNNKCITDTCFCITELIKENHKIVLDCFRRDNSPKIFNFKEIVLKFSLADLNTKIELLFLVISLINYTSDFLLRIDVRRQLLIDGFEEVLKNLNKEKITSESEEVNLILKNYNNSLQQDTLKYYQNMSLIQQEFGSSLECFTYLTELFQNKNCSKYLTYILHHILAIIKAGRNPDSLMRLIDEEIFQLAVDVFHPLGSSEFNIDFSNLLENFEFEENWKQVKSLNVVLSDRLKSSNEKISKLEIQSLDLTNKNQASMQEYEALKNSTVPSEEHSNILKKIAEFQEKLKLSEEENNKLKQLQTATLAKPQAKSSQILEDKENIRSEEPKPQEIKPINEVPEPVKGEEKPQPSKEVTNETKKPAENVLKVVETGYISKEATKETEKLTEDSPKVVETADTSKEASNETAKPVEETPKLIDTPKPAAKPKGKKKVMKRTPKVTLPELKAHKLANPTKRFGWIKLATIKETSVWYKMLSDQDRYIDEDYQTILAECFSQKPKVNTNQDSKILIKTENSKIYHVLDSKNAQNFSITIASTKCSPQKLAEKISNSDPTLPTSFINLVHEMLNNKGIISNFNSLEVPMEELYDAEKLLKTVCEIPGINDQLSCILFSRKFNEHYGATESTIDLIKGALDEILAVPEFNQILEIVLKFGNMLNFGLNIGSAYGFQFQTLGSLLDCKIVGGHEYYSNLLDIIVDFVKKKHPELVKFYVSLIEIHSIERSDMAESVREFNNLKMEFEKIEKKFERISSLIEDSNSPFIDKFSKFIGESKDNLKALDLKIEICNKTIHDFCSLYEVDTNNEPINQTVSHIITFANNFAKSSKEIDNKIKKAARINSLAASKSSDSDNRRRSAMPPPKEATNAMMNDLAAILKARKHK